MSWNELPRPNRSSAVPLYDQVEEILRQAIRAGDLEPGQPLPSEPELAATFGVSRLTVRRSLGDLQRAGLIVRRHGVGTFVARVTEAQIIPSSLSFTKNMQMVGLEPTSTVISLTEASCPDFVAGALEIAEGDPVLVLERLRLADSEPIALERAWLNGFHVPHLDPQAVEQGSLYDYLAVRHGIEVVAMDQTMEPVILSTSEADLLHSKEGAPAILSEIVGYSQEGIPVEYTRSLTPAGRARFHFHFRQGDVGRRGLRREEDSTAPHLEGSRP